VSPSRHPMTYYFCNRFVLTDDEAYFVPYRSELDFPPMVDVLREIFDLDDPEVYREVRTGLAVGRIIVGDFYTSTEEVVIQAPSERSGYVERRIREVFGP
jgi:hypothetical protein